MSILNDAKFAFTTMNSTLFPNVPDGVQVHDGFAYTQGRTADSVLAAVQGALAGGKASKVLVHGHSLGAAVAMLDSLMLRMALDASVPVSTTVFGLPRGGNQAFADLLDSTVRAAPLRHPPAPC
jgi:predicted lipase